MSAYFTTQVSQNIAGLVEVVVNDEILAELQASDKQPEAAPRARNPSLEAPFRHRGNTEAPPMSPLSPLPADRLARLTDPANLVFETTDDLEPLENVIGQDRAVEAVRFGIGIRQEGYNLFALRPPGVGKHSMVRRFLERRAPDEPTPRDWAYVHNFGAPHRPNALRLPAGRGRTLRDDMERLVDELRSAIPAVFESDEYRARRQSLEQQMRERHE